MRPSWSERLRSRPASAGMQGPSLGDRGGDSVDEGDRKGFVMPQYDLPETELAAYRSAVVPPADLSGFWSSTLAESRAQGWETKAEPVDTGLTVVETYDVTFAGFGGHPVRAWYRRPTGVDDDLPVVVRYHGYNTGRDLPHQTSMWPLAGYASLDVDNRGQGSAGGYIGDTGDPVGSAPSGAGFLTRGILGRETFYYRRLITDAVLAIDAARALPGIAASRVAVTGTSQGGGLALAVSGLATGISAVMADVPFLCDFPRGVAIAPGAGYSEIAGFLGTHRGQHQRVFEVLAYFDAAVLVPSATARALFSVALMDEVCPPSTVYAAYHAYAGPKAIAVYPFNNHEGGQFHHEAEQLSWLRAVMPAA